MKNNLLIHFLNNGQVNWARFDKKMELLAQGTVADLAELPTAARADNSYALVPSTALLLTQATVPTRQKQRLRQAVPYALEEQLATDIDELHFALADKPNNGQIATAVVAETQMQQWCERIQASPLSIKNLYPDVLAVPLPSEGWGILLTDTQALVRTHIQQGFAVELDNLALALQVAMQVDEPPSTLSVYPTTADASTILTVLHGLGIPIREEQHSQGQWHWLMQGIMQHKPLNLLQAQYQVAQAHLTQWQPWRLTLGLLLAAGMILLAQQWLVYQQLQQQRSVLNTQIRQVYQQTFPEARRIVNPRVQMQQRLDDLRKQVAQPTTQTHFLSLLTQVSPALQQIEALKIKRMDYRNQQLDLTITLSNLQHLEQLQTQLKAQQLQVTLQNASSQAQQVEARLKIEQ